MVYDSNCVDHLVLKVHQQPSRQPDMNKHHQNTRKVLIKLLERYLPRSIRYMKLQKRSVLGLPGLSEALRKF